MRGKRNFLSEFAVNIYSARWLVISSSQLASDKEMNEVDKAVSDNCHIYLICRHPAASYVKDAFKYENGKVTGEVAYKIQGVERRVAFDFPFPLLDDAVEVKLSDYPHRELRTVDKDGRTVRYLPASLICLSPERRAGNEDLGRFEVLYVGQSFADGKRSAFDRLKAHATLQKVLADVHYESPDSEVFLGMFEYLPYRVINQMDGRALGAISDERDEERFFSILENPLTQRQQICLTEAALIRYFQPKYNEIYKEHFPSPTHKILQECYKLDFSGLIVEINTDEVDFELYSERVPSNSHHIAKIDLFGHEERCGFFFLSKGDGSFLEMGDVIR